MNLSLSLSITSSVVSGGGPRAPAGTVFLSWTTADDSAVPITWTDQDGREQRLVWSI